MFRGHLTAQKKRSMSVPTQTSPCIMAVEEAQYFERIALRSVGTCIISVPNR